MACSTQSLARLAALALGLVSCSTAPDVREEPAGLVATTGAARHGILPMPRAPLDLSTSAGTGLSLKELLARVSSLTGVTYSMSDATTEHLSHAMVALSQTKQIPVAEVYPWAESILQQNGYTLAILESGIAPLVGVQSRSDMTRTAPPTRLDSADFQECRMHPATLFSTVLTLPNTDVRSVGNSLRVLAPDTQSGGVIPVGMTNNVILSGTGRDVADIAALLLTVDAESKLKSMAPPQGAAPSKQ